MNKIKSPLKPNYITTFIIKFSAIILFGFWLSGLVIIISLDRNLGTSYKEGIQALSQLKNNLPYIIFIITVIQTLALCVITFLLSLIWSHNIAGPIIRFKRYLKEISCGRLLKERIAFRNTDQLQDLAKELSEVMLSDRNNSSQALAFLVEAQKLLDECFAFSKDPKIVEGKLKELTAVYRNIRDIYKQSLP